jgi:ribosomal 50S subunit-recycling heat shock protein
MRLDKFLQVSRIIKRRTLANEVCDRGAVLVNGQVAKAGRKVQPGDRIEVNLGPKGRLIVEVLEVPAGNVGKAKADSLYRVIAKEPPSQI